MLQAVIDDPTPRPSVQPERKLELPGQPLLTSALRQQLIQNFFAGYDNEHGSWGTDQKFLHWDSVEYAMDLARLKNDSRAEHMARQTLAEQLHLLDPAWGGVYQYSTDGDWNSPHFEKIMQMQAENLRIYSLAYAQWRDPQYLHAAQEIQRYLRTFLTSPTGAVYTSHGAELEAAVDDRRLLARGRVGVVFMQQHLRVTRRVGLPRASPAGHSDSPHPQRDENVIVARTANLLFHYTGSTEYEQLAKDAMRYLAAKPVVDRLPASSALVAALAIGSEPLHLTVVGHKDDAVAHTLFQAALRC